MMAINNQSRNETEQNSNENGENSLYLKNMAKKE